MAPDRLDHTVAVTVPSTDGLSAPLTAAAFAARTESILLLLVETFGGATATPGRGAYVAGDGTLVLEDVNVVSAYTDAAGLTALPVLLDTVRTLGHDVWRQESTLVALDGSALLFA